MESSVLAQMEAFDHEEVVFFQNNDVGLKAIVAIHNTTLGPALGGTRMYPYATEAEALQDVLRLSRGMTYKAAASGLSLGGGKAVIIGDPKGGKSYSLFAAYGRFLNTLAGRFITAEDSGTDVNDIEYIYTETDYVVGIETSHGGSGDPSPFTALGVFQGIKAALLRQCGSENLQGKTMAIQGVGNVGQHLARLLARAGARVVVADVDTERVAKICKELPTLEVVPAEQILSTPCDVFAPCALGAVINAQTIDALRCQVIAGAANNQLDCVERAEDLRQRKILYAPDYVINAGGLINVYLELEAYSSERANRMTRQIYHNLLEVFEISEQQDITTARAANHMVEQRLAKAGRSGNVWSPSTKDRYKMLHERRARY